MNDEQKQIEEMAKEFSPYRAYCNSVKCEECVRQKMSKCRYYSFTKRFFLNGYRKQSDTAREIKEKIFEKGQFFFSKVFSKDIYEVSFTMTLDEFNKIVAQYGVEVEE